MKNSLVYNFFLKFIFSKVKFIHSIECLILCTRLVLCLFSCPLGALNHYEDRSPLKQVLKGVNGSPDVSCVLYFQIDL